MSWTPDQGPGEAGEKNQGSRTDDDDPEGERAVLQAGKEIPEQRHGSGVGIYAVGVRSEDPSADQPDQQWHADEAEEECATEDDQLAGDSRTGSERVGRVGRRILQSRAP